jgi:predicted phosphodiesterase
LLCVSDIHGQADALAAVLATGERRGYTQLLVAGDLCYPGPKPLETWRCLIREKAICVQGLSDRALASLDISRVRPRCQHDRARLNRVTAVRTELGELILARLARLAPTFRLPLQDGGELLLVHGSPADPFQPICHDMSDDEVLSLLGDDPADIVICGGSHVPFDRIVSGVRIVNVGSVGEAPNSQRKELKLENFEASLHGGEPTHAHATFVELRAGEVQVEQFVVPLGRAA